MSFENAWKQEVRRRLERDYLPKIQAILRAASLEDLWWRPNERSNAIGNLVLHLAGNVRQWVVSGIGGESDVRRREEEFRERASLDASFLERRITEAVSEALAILEGLTDDRWLEPRTIQGYSETTFSAVFHVVEHFSGHVGQMLYVAKLRGLDLPAFYRPDGSGGA